MRKATGDHDCRNASGGGRRKRAAECEEQGKLRSAAHWDIPGGPVFSVCGQICDQRINAHSKQAKKVVEIANFEEISELFAGINLLISMGHFFR